jgi:hypothetical protein
MYLPNGYYEFYADVPVMNHLPTSSYENPFPIAPSISQRSRVHQRQDLVSERLLRPVSKEVAELSFSQPALRVVGHDSTM